MHRLFFKNKTLLPWLTPVIILIMMVPLQSYGQKSLHFDFGTGSVAPGYKSVDAVTTYSPETGYGFDYGTQSIAVNRTRTAQKGGAKATAEDPLTSDFCTVAGSLFFSVKLQPGIYQVTATLGDLYGFGKTTIKAESRRLMVKEIVTEPGEFKKVSFLVRIWDSTIHPGSVVKLKPREVDKLDWDDKLTLEFSNQRPCLNALDIERIDAQKTLTVFLSGNSTVTDQQLEPWACWGQMITSFFGPDKVAFANMAASGETLRSSIGRGRLAKIGAMLQPGDYLFIEFAHNDQKKGSGEVAFGSYNEYLRTFIDTARAHQAIPVLVTSTHRRNFDDQGNVVNTLGDFPAAMRQEAKKSHVALLDLNTSTGILYKAFGPTLSKDLFVQFPKGSFPGQTEALADNTHFSDFGAYELAKCIVKLISESDLALKKYVQQGLSAFDPGRPDDARQFDLPYTPMFTSVKPYGN